MSVNEDNPFLSLPAWIPRFIRNIWHAFDGLDIHDYFAGQRQLVAKLLSLDVNSDDVPFELIHELRVVVSREITAESTKRGVGMNWLLWEWLYGDGAETFLDRVRLRDELRMVKAEWTRNNGEVS